MGLILSKLSGARGYLNYRRGIDSDAQAFLTAASITNIVQQKAVNDLVIALKGYSIWTKMKALYPVVGGTAASHKWNLKDPRDLDAAFRLTFTAGWVHSSNGMLPNGSSDYANTFFTSYSQNSQNLSYYSRTDSNTGFDFGNISTGSTGALYLIIRDTGNIYLRVNTTAAESSIANSNGQGFYQINRAASNKQSLFKNNTKTDFTVNSNGVPSGAIHLGRITVITANYYGNKQCAFASIGDGLTDTEAANFYTAVQAFQTALGRQV